MPTEICRTAYTLAELKAEYPKGYAHALHTLADFATDDRWWEGVYEYQTERLAAEGFENVEIQFSGFSSQGDGASFTASVDPLAYIKAHKLGSRYRLLASALQSGEVDLTVSVERTSSHYVHEHTCRTSVELYCGSLPAPEWIARVEAQANALEEHIEARRLELSREIYKALREDFEYLTSEEVCIEMADANEYVFYSSGALA